MKKIIKHSLSVIALGVMAFSVTGCEDWTEMESLDIDINSWENQNPGLYADYLEDLRNYKKSDHKLLFVAFNNPEEMPIRQVERLTALPDSVDIVSLTRPDNLHPDVQKEMNEVRQKKGMQFIYSISFDQIEAEWIAILKEEGADKYTEEDALAYIGSRTEEMLALCDKYGYDGLTATYSGKSLVGLGEEELAKYSLRQKTFLDLVAAWKENHKDKTLAFEGNVQFLVPENMNILSECQYVILMTTMCTNTGSMEIAGSWALESASGLLDNATFIMAVSTVPLGEDDNGTIGYFGSVGADGKQVRAISGTANWMNKSGKFDKGGMLIYNPENDYFNPLSNYQSIREAIGTMNPSPKN